MYATTMNVLLRSALASTSKILNQNSVRFVHLKYLEPIVPKNRVSTLLNRSFKPLLICARNASDKRTMVAKPSDINLWMTFDRVHFFIMLGVIPSLLTVFIVNTFIGQAELADIPEDYEPKHWEYHKHPISRFIAKYMMENPQKVYESILANAYDSQKRREVVEEARWFRQSQRTEGDYRGWYFIPVNPSGVNRARREYELDQEIGELVSR